MIFAERALAVDSGLHVLLINPLQLASFSKTCVMSCTEGDSSHVSRDWFWDGNAEEIHLKVDVPGLTTTDGPLSLDDNNRNSANATLAGLLDLIFDCLDILIRVEVCDGLDAVVKESDAMQDSGFV